MKYITMYAESIHDAVQTVSSGSPLSILHDNAKASFLSFSGDLLRSFLSGKNNAITCWHYANSVNLRTRLKALRWFCPSLAASITTHHRNALMEFKFVRDLAHTKRYAEFSQHLSFAHSVEALLDDDDYPMLTQHAKCSRMRKAMNLFMATWVPQLFRQNNLERNALVSKLTAEGWTILGTRPPLEDILAQFLPDENILVARKQDR
ncbi:MAG: hypothetical protein Q7U84_05085, partial [Polynucleobacter sp.]|nr:hypothetical protein [Polynucleobacter sp.]